MVNRDFGATSAPLHLREELLAVRTGEWRLLVPMRHVERVHPAALPAAVPSATGRLPPVVAVGDELVAVVFAGALFGAREARLAGAHKMVLLSDGRRRAILWVDAVEDVVEHTPAASPARRPEEMVIGWSGGDRTLAVLDVRRLLDVVLEPVQQASGVCA